MRNLSKVEALKGSSFFETFENVNIFSQAKKTYSSVCKKANTVKGKEFFTPYKETFESVFDKDFTSDNLKKWLESSRRALLEYKYSKKIAKGKKISFLEQKRLNSPQFQKTEKFVKQNLIIAGIGCAMNHEDINKAKENVGTKAMLEEIAKTTIMYTCIGRALKFTKPAALTILSYKPNLNYPVNLARIGISVAGLCSLKPAFDSIWQTEYEKKQNNS